MMRWFRRIFRRHQRDPWIITPLELRIRVQAARRGL